MARSSTLRRTAPVPRVATLAALPSLEQIDAIRGGVAAQIFDQIATALGVAKETLARALNINAQTLRKRKSQILSADEAEKTLRVARVFAFAAEVLGGEEEARTWLNQKVPALAGKRPLDLLDTDVGAQEVTNLLGGIKWGLYA